MKARPVLYTLGAFLFILGLTMLVPLACSLYYGEADAWSFILSVGITSGTGGALYFASRPKEKKIVLSRREGFLIVSAGWILAAFFGGLPYMIHGALPALTDAYFETMSGFTTTGATVITKIEGLPHGILLWRSMTQWLGGMGIIVLSVAVLPFLGVGGRQLFKAELPGPVKDKLEPRIAEAARSLWMVYGIITVIGFIFFLLGGMNVFDAVNHILCAMATGGFSTKDTSVAWFNSTYIDGVFIVFMLLAGINFTLHYQALTGNFRSLFRNSELKFFLGTVLAATLLITVDLRLHLFPEVGKAFRYALFQTSSIMTTTGFVTDNFARWPAFSQIILVLLMFIGGSAGSTGGGIKCVRLLLILKDSYRELYRLVHPHAVTQVKLDHMTVPPEVMKSIWGFFALYIGLATLATIMMSALGLDMLTSFSSVVATIGNIGPGLGLVHPESTYSEIPTVGKWILSFCMLIGRLEIYTILVLLIPEFWKK
ncbi:MAG: TrkH family potassium uptake protein [Proteobacteria bacterium]|nr:TrkH family potassium uptake protein [Pseudomonadota bacterium]MBU4583137.1 TrkH family potassium uptake protein [Pseudomonadota bacterium]